MRVVAGQPSWRLASKSVEAFVTRAGGHVGPVTFDRQGAARRPYNVAPWVKEKIDPQLPPILKVLRGDFFCLPFGANETAYRGEQHPLHGETANRHWILREQTRGGGRHTLRLRMNLKVRRGRVDREVALVDGHDAVYTRHVIRGMQGPMTFGHHAMLRFPDVEGCARITTSRLSGGMTAPLPVEDPAAKGYSTLAVGRWFTRLDRVPMVAGGRTDVSTFPARRGFEDIVQLVNRPGERLAWIAATVPSERWVWFALKDPRVLTGTLLWLSNGGRHYAPWSGRHVNVLGIEDLTSYFHYGLAESVKSNPLRERGVTTFHRLHQDRPQAVNYIQACVAAPARFDRVQRIEPQDDGRGVILVGAGRQRIKVPLDLEFLWSKGD